MFLAMTTSSALFFPTDFLKNIEASSTDLAVSMLQEVAKSALRGFLPYIPWAVGILFVGLVVASIRAILGRTGMLGSLLYHIFYFGILATIVWIKGLGILFNPYFDLICAVLYTLCYWLTGLILKRIKRR